MSSDLGIGSSKGSSSRPTTPAPKAEPKTESKVGGRTETARDGFQPARTTARPPVAGIGAAKAAAEPSTPAEQAKALIEKHTNTFGLNLDEAGLGKELAAMAAADPAKNGPVIKEVFNQLGSTLLGGDNKEQVAQQMAKNLTDDQMKQLSSTKDGRAVLEDVKTQLERNGVTPAEKAAIDRINGAYSEPKNLDEIKAGLKEGRTDDAFRNGVAKYFGSLGADDAHKAMESIRADGLQRQLIDSVMRDKDGNPSDVRLRDGIETMLNTGRVDFMVAQISSKSYNVFTGSANGTSDSHFFPSGDAKEGVYINVDRANDAAELPRTLVHETFHAFAHDHGSNGGAAEEGMGIALIHYAFTDGKYNVAEAIYGTKNWYRDDGRDGDIEMGDFSNADPQLREVLQSVSARDESQVAWDNPEQLQSDYDKFWSGTNRFDPPGNWEANVPYMTQSMLYERQRAQLEGQGLTPDQILNALGPPPSPPTKP